MWPGWAQLVGEADLCTLSWDLDSVTGFLLSLHSTSPMSALCEHVCTHACVFLWIHAGGLGTA